MLYFIALGILFLIATYVFYRIHLLDIYLLAVGVASLVMAFMIGVWFGDGIFGVIFFIVGIVLIVSMLWYRSKQAF